MIIDPAQTKDPAMIIRWPPYDFNFVIYITVLCQLLLNILLGYIEYIFTYMIYINISLDIEYIRIFGEQSEYFSNCDSHHVTCYVNYKNKTFIGCGYKATKPRQ